MTKSKHVVSNLMFFFDRAS